MPRCGVIGGENAFQIKNQGSVVFALYRYCLDFESWRVIWSFSDGFLFVIMFTLGGAVVVVLSQANTVN